ncbi:MAG: hypothetical protein HY815_19340 [Candidatus Riflebacteria bacterium]|nr:hypothetical protein [Candidatus Riflebacteria bacterium]
MHLLQIFVHGAAWHPPLELVFGTPASLRPWTVLPAGRARTDALVAIAASLAPGKIASLLEPRLGARFGPRGSVLRTEFTYFRDGRDQGPHGSRRGGWELVDGRWRLLRPARPGSGDAPGERLDSWLRSSAPQGNLVLAYGHAAGHRATADFDFSDTGYPYRRIGSLVDPRGRLTHPVRFLERVNLKAHRCGTARQKQVLARLGQAIASVLNSGDRGRHGRDTPGGLSPDRWTQRAVCFSKAWRQLQVWERKALTVLIDAARHANDAFPQCPCPFDQPGIMLLDRPDRFCPPGRLEGLFTALDALFPRFQFVLTVGSAARARFPEPLASRRLGPAPATPSYSPPYKRAVIDPAARSIPRGCILLVQVDGTLPNVALMQLSRHFKSSGHRVALVKGSPDVREPAAVYASCVFTAPASKRRVEDLRRRYGDRLVVGGSGVDLARRLDSQIEALAPDYSLYPGLGDRAIGFLTRGCPGRCPFCVVPRKEGRVRQVADLDMLMQGRRTKLILLDDNLLAHPGATEMLEEMVRRKLSVNFNQTLDLRRLDAEQAELLRRLDCAGATFHRRVYQFSLNDCRGLDRLRRRYSLLKVRSEDQAEFVAMYGYDTSLREDLERLQFLRSLPRAYVCMQRYEPVPGGPAPDLSRLFDERSDEHLDALIRVVFPQNMKNVEKYYRWLCFEYARQRGRIHLGLVDTLFRYNHRHRRGEFLQRLHEIARLAPAARRLGRRTP